MSGPRMGMSQMNGNNNSNNRRPPNLSRIPSNEKQYTSQHDELIKYHYDSWNKISQEVDRNTGSSVVFYQEPENVHLKDFQPFNLEAFWGLRVVQNVQQQPKS